MDFKQFLVKTKDKNVISDRNHPSSYFQKRLEAFLKTSPFKGSINPVFSQENIEKLKQSLIPVLIMKTIVKLSVFNAIKHHKTITNKLQKGHYLLEWNELQNKIEFLKKKPCDFLAKTLENSEENNKNRKLLELVLKRNQMNAFYSEKVRSYFHSWRLVAFENGLRKISIHHSEIIEKQIIDQLNNIYIMVVKPIMQNGFRAIQEASKKKSKKTKKSQTKTEKLKFAFIILHAVVRERISGLQLLGFEMIREGVDLRKAGFLKQKMQKEFKNRNFAMGLKIIRNIFKSKKLDSFLVLKNCSCAMIKNKIPNRDNDDFRLLGLKIVGKIFENKTCLIKKAVIYRMSEFLLYARQRSSLLNQVLTKFTNKTKRKYLHRWDLISMKMKDPLICTKQRISSHPPSKKTKSMSFLKLNKQIIVNQALVNAALEVEQKKKNEKLLKINQNLGLIEIETLIERKRKLYSRVFLNNLTILGTFEAKRYQEFEHYLKILQEEKEILHNEVEEIENYNKKFAKHLDQKMYSIWGGGTGSGVGTLPATDEKSGQEGLIDHNSLFNEENEEVIISINYLEFLEKQNVELKEELAKNEQRIKHEEDKFESDLNMLKENIKALQMKSSDSGFKPKKSKLSDKKYSMIKSINSYFSKKSFTHDQSDSD